MSKIYQLIIILFVLNHCSLDTKSGVWSESNRNNIKSENLEKKLFEKAKIYKEEFNTDLKIKLKSNFKKNSFINNLSNNNGIVNFNGDLNKISKFKFSKIEKFDEYQPELLLTNEGLVLFFDDKGTIFSFGNEKKEIWRNNIYSKNEKKLKPILYFGSDNKIVVVADSIANYYAIDLFTGNLLWKKRNSSPFNSQIKIYKNKFFVIDFENVLRCFSIEDGKEIWKFKTEKSFIKSQQKLSFVINNNKLIFINTLGDLSSIDIETGNLAWQAPTQSSAIYENYFSLKNSDLIYSDKTIYFSNNQNEFFAINEENGRVKWKQAINSNLRPTFADNIVFTVTLEGYLVLIDSRNGNIIRMTNVLSKIKNYEKKNIKPEGFVLTKNKIYLSLNNGRVVIIDVHLGKPINIIKIDNQKISRPYFMKQHMYLTKNNAIIKLK